MIIGLHHAQVTSSKGEEGKKILLLNFRFTREKNRITKRTKGFLVEVGDQNAQIGTEDGRGIL